MRPVAFVFAVLLALLCGCGGGPSSSSTGGTTGGSAGPEPWPQVPNQGGPVLAQPQLATITFDADPNQATLESFDDWIVSSGWLTTVGADYGVGGGTHLQKVEVAADAGSALTSAEIESFLEDLITTGTAPAPGPNVVYLLYYPSTTTITDPVLGTSCQDFVGFHGELQSASTMADDIPFGVVTSCPSDAGPLVIEEQDASHELIESATDPFPDDRPAWLLTNDTSPFSALGGEVADLCLGVTTTESGWSVQRVWSNTAAAAGGSPCVPAVSSPPYLGFSVSPSKVLVGPPGTTFQLTLSAWGASTAAPATVTLATFFGFDVSPTVGVSMLLPGTVTPFTLSIPSTAHAGDTTLLDLHAESTDDTNDWPIELRAQ